MGRPKKTKSGVRIDPKTGIADTGRKTVMTEETLNNLKLAFALGCSDREACLYADISEQTLYNYQKKNPKFIEQKQILKETPVLKARQEVVKGLNNNPELALRFLERKKKDEFSLRTEHTGKDGGEIETKITSEENEVLDSLIGLVKDQIKKKKLKND